MRLPTRLAGLLLGAAACALPTDTCACTPPPAFGVLYGVVQTASGAPAAGAQIRVEARRPDCGASRPDEVTVNRFATADQAGRYRQEFAVFRPGSYCLTVVARNAAATADGPAVTGIRLDLVVAPQVRDSVRVDLQVP